KVIQELRQYLSDHSVTIGSIKALAFADFIAYLIARFKCGKGISLRVNDKNEWFLDETKTLQPSWVNPVRRWSNEEIAVVNFSLLSSLLQEMRPDIERDITLLLIQRDIERGKVMLPGYLKAYDYIETFYPKLRLVLLEWSFQQM